MVERTVTLTLSDTLYQRLQSRAQAASQPIDRLAVEVLDQAMPPSVEESLPPDLRMELQAMEHLSDEVLWQIAQGTMNSDKVALYDVLLERHLTGTLTPEGQEMLARLREEAEALMLRKAHAYNLLHSRGHQLPPLEQLHDRKS
jgi:hypothetical protein